MLGFLQKRLSPTAIMALCSRNAFASKVFLTGLELAVIASSSAALCELDVPGIRVLMELPLWVLTLGESPGGSGITLQCKGKGQERRGEGDTKYLSNEVRGKYTNMIGVLRLGTPEECH